MNNEVIEILTKVGAIISNDHFVGASGLHFDTYVNKDFLFLHPKETSKICKLLAEKYKNENIEIVVGPAMGGIILSQWLANSLSDIYGKEVLSVYSEKTENERQELRRGYSEQVKGKRVLVVEDIITTGESLVKALDAVRKIGGNIIGACALVNKNESLNPIKIFGVPFYALADLYTPTYKKEDCPLCKTKVPINTQFGHGNKFLVKSK